MSVRNVSAVRKEVRSGELHWVIDFRYRDKNGRSRRYRRDASVQAAGAARAESERLYALAMTTGSLEMRKQSSTLRDFANGTFTDLFMPRYRAGTRKRYVALLRQGLLDELGSKRLDAIGVIEARSFAAWLTTRDIGVKGPMNLLRSMLRAAHEVGEIDELPKLPRLHKDSRKLPDAPSVDEVLAMLAVTKDWLRPAVALAAFAGLRMGEVRALEVRDVDLVNSVINVRRSMSENTLTTPKSGNDRQVPISPELHAVLKEAVRNKLPQARIIVTKRGTTPGRTFVLAKLRKYQRDNNLQDRSFHSLRHFFCSALMRMGANPEAVRMLAGHSSLSVTQRYLHATAADITSAFAKLAGN